MSGSTPNTRAVYTLLITVVNAAAAAHSFRVPLHEVEEVVALSALLLAHTAAPETTTVVHLVLVEPQLHYVPRRGLSVLHEDDVPAVGAGRVATKVAVAAPLLLPRMRHRRQLHVPRQR